jgi:hypothetical protein
MSAMARCGLKGDANNHGLDKTTSPVQIVIIRNGLLSQVKFSARRVKLILEDGILLDGLPTDGIDAICEIDLSRLTGRINLDDKKPMLELPQLAQLQHVEWARGLESVGNRWFPHTALAIVDLRGTCVRRLGDSAFSRSTGLVRLEAPGTLEEIGVGCFGGTALECVLLCNCRRLRLVSPLAFQECPKLRRLVLPAHAVMAGESIYSQSPLEELEFGGIRGLYTGRLARVHDMTVRFLRASRVSVTLRSAGNVRVRSMFPGFSGIEQVVFAGSAGMGGAVVRPLPPAP